MRKSEIRNPIPIPIPIPIPNLAYVVSLWWYVHVRHYITLLLAAFLMRADGLANVFSLLH